MWHAIYHFLTSEDAVLTSDVVRGHGSSYWMRHDVNILAEDYANAIVEKLKSNGIPNADYSVLYTIPNKYRDLISSYLDDFIEQAREIYSMTDEEAHRWNDEHHLR